MSKVKTAPNQTEKPVQVFVRVRPLNQIERNGKSFSVVNVNNGREVSVKERPIEKTSRNFTFDKVFGPDSKQVDVYKRVVYPLIDEVLAGYNCTVFAYGQTGTGKTFTMEGEKSDNANISWEEDPLTGIIPRSLSHLFDELRIKQLENTVRVSFLELYNEELFDLLSPVEDSSKLKLFEDSNKKGSVIIQNLEEIPVSNKEQVYKIMEKGSQKRQTAATLMNAHSSRSHTIFSITVHIKETSDKGEELFKIGKLNLVDLAGSENIGRSGAVDKRAREAGNINQSLLTLGRVITSLVEKTPHIPYRESKLTRLLQDSLGGRTKTSIVATVSPALCNLEETMSTLEYATRAKSITNKPEINQKLTKKAFLKEYSEEVEKLKRDLQAARDKNGMYVDPENYTRMVVQIEDQEKEISKNISLRRTLEAQMEKREEIYNELCASHEKIKEDLEKRKQSCKEARQALKETTIDRDENKLLKEKHMDTERKLRQQAEKILNVADVATADTIKLHEKIERKGCVEINNTTACDRFCSSLKSQFEEMSSNVERQGCIEVEFFNLLKASLANNSKIKDECMEKLRDYLKAVCQVLSEQMANYTGLCQNSRKEKHTKLMEDLSGLKHKLDANKTMLDANIAEGIIPQLTDVFDHLNDLDKFLVKFNQTGDKVTKDVSHLNDEMMKIKKSFKESLEALLTKSKSIEAQKDELKKLDDMLLEVDNRLKEHDQTLMSKAQDESSNFDKVQQDRISEFLKEQKSMLSTFMKAQSEMSCKFAKALSEMSSKFAETQREDFSKSDGTKSELWKKREDILMAREEVVKQMHTDLKGLSDSITEEVKACEPNFADANSLIETVKNSLTQQQETTVEKLQSWKSSETERLESVMVNVENLSTVSDESKKILNSWSKGFEKGLVESDAKEVLIEKEFSQNVLEEITEQVSDSETVINDFMDCHQTATLELENNIEDRQVNSQRDRKELIETLKLQNCLVEKFRLEDIKKDVPTGCTPQKREFDYPHDLIATSPHEIILSRFRATYSPDVSFNDSLDEPVPSEETENSSSTESLSTISSSTQSDQKENDEIIISSKTKGVNSFIPRSVEKKRILGEIN